MKKDIAVVEVFYRLCFSVVHSWQFKVFRHVIWHWLIGRISEQFTRIPDAIQTPELILKPWLSRNDCTICNSLFAPMSRFRSTSRKSISHPLTLIAWAVWFPPLHMMWSAEDSAHFTQYPLSPIHHQWEMIVSSILPETFYGEEIWMMWCVCYSRAEMSGHCHGRVERSTCTEFSNTCAWEDALDWPEGSCVN
jgi:hypothetical protein